MPFTRINVLEAKSLISDNEAQVIDIRDPASFQSGHIENSVHIDNSNVQQFLDQADKSKPLIVCCYHGNMSQGAADFFNQQGFVQSYSLDGGYKAWALQAL